MKDLLNKRIRLFESCVTVRGAYRSVIMDLQRSKVEFIPNDLVSLIENNKFKTISEIQNELIPENDKETFIEYINFLRENEFAFF